MDNRSYKDADVNRPDPSEHERIAEQAACWHAAVCRDDMDWEGFTLWLEADPRHRDCYNEIALADAALDAHRGALSQSQAPEAWRNRSQSFGRNWGRNGGMGAVAAALVAALMLPSLLRSPEASFVTQGASRTIALPDGSQVVLAPHSTLVARGSGMEHLTLSGGAWFAVRHNPGRALDITADSVVIRDIGTHFNVQADDKVVRVAVEEGTVSVGAQALDKPISLTGGRALRFDPGAGLAEVESIEPSAAGSWRNGQLRYENAPVGLVAADLARYGNVRIAVPAALRDRRFTGILSIKDMDRTIGDLAQLMDLSVVRGADGYHLSAGHS